MSANSDTKKGMTRSAFETPRGVLRLAVWFALMTAGGELLVQSIRKYAQGRELFLSQHFIWLTPVSYLLIFTAIAGLLILAGNLWRPLRSVRVSASAFTFAAVAALLLFVQRLHTGALLVLAAGIAVNLSLIIARRAEGFEKLTKRSIPVLTGLILVGALASIGFRYAQTQRAVRGLPTARAGAPNIVLIIWDTVRALSVSANGYHRPTTPTLERLADAGIYFERAMSTSPWTLPSHASMFTGRYPHELSTDFNTPLDAKHPTIAEVLGHHGYRTAGFVANTLYAGYEHGLQRGFQDYRDYRIDGSELLLSSAIGRALAANQRIRNWLGAYDVVGRKAAPQVTDEFLAWLPEAADRPFFAFLNYYDAHEPYLPPPPYAGQFGSLRDRRMRGLDYSQLRHATRWGKRHMKDAARDMERSAYDGAIAYLDHELNRLIAALQQRGLLENTLVVLTSDHGEHLGSHKGLWGHGNSLYTQEIHVPLVIIPAGGVLHARIEQPVSLRDLAATMLDLSIGGQRHALPGVSLAGLWEGASRSGRLVPSPVISQFWERGRGMRSVVLDRYHYIYDNGREEVYDLRQDPAENHDLIASGRISKQRLLALRAVAAKWPMNNTSHASD